MVINNQGGTALDYRINDCMNLTAEEKSFITNVGWEISNTLRGVLQPHNFVYFILYYKSIDSHDEKGDVLYTKVGTYGIPAYVNTEKEFCLYVSVCLIKPKHERINARFLSIQMAMPFIKHQADAQLKDIIFSIPWHSEGMIMQAFADYSR